MPANAGYALSNEMRTFLKEQGLESLALTFSSEDISLGELRNMAADADSFHDSMKALNVPHASIEPMREALQSDVSDMRTTISAKSVEDSSSAIEALAAMARAKPASAPKPADTASILAAALGKVANVSVPLASTDVAPAEPKQSAYVSLADSNLSYDSWQQSSQAGKAPSSAPRANAALLAYQNRGGTADIADGQETSDKVANKETQIVLASGQTRAKTKQFIPVYMSSR